LTNWAGSAFCAKKFVAAQHNAIDKINFFICFNSFKS
jgi:hypothetical protein